jgi:hypothetical protein
MPCVDVSRAVCRIAGTPLQDDFNRLRGSLKAAMTHLRVAPSDRHGRRWRSLLACVAALPGTAALIDALAVVGVDLADLVEESAAA